MQAQLLMPPPSLALVLAFFIAISNLALWWFYTVNVQQQVDTGVRGPYDHFTSFQNNKGGIGCPKVLSIFGRQAKATDLEELRPPPRGHQRPTAGGHSRLASYIECRRADAALERICHFENICWDREDERFTFFSAPNTPDELVVHDTGIARLSDPGVLAELVRTTAGIPHRPQFLPMAFKKALVPVEEAIWHSPHVHVAFRSFCAENFGHALGDDIMPAYSLMKAFDLVTDDVQLMTIGPCCDTLIPFHGMEGYERAKRNLDNMTKLISSYPFADTSTESYFSKATRNAANESTHKRYTCMRHLLGGHANLGVGFDRDFAWSSFIDAALCRARRAWPEAWDVLGPPSPGRHLILVVKKVVRSQILNHDEIVAGLRDSFVPSGTRQSFAGTVDVLSVDPASLPLPKQMALCQQAALVITPCGGISFFASFLPRGKAAIFVGYWDTGSNRSENMEGFLWRYVTRQFAFFYDVRKEDITILPPGNAARGEWYDYRDYGAVTVNVEKMVALAEQALRTVAKA